MHKPNKKDASAAKDNDKSEIKKSTDSNDTDGGNDLYNGLTRPPIYSHPPDPILPPPTSPPILTFGVIADVQYAPIPDGQSYMGIKRFYRNALVTAKLAGRAFQNHGVSFALNLGDIIDGKCKDIDQSGGSVAEFVAAGGEEWDLKGESPNGTCTKDGVGVVPHSGTDYDDDDDDMKDPAAVALKAVLRALAPYQCGPLYHVYGNHELYHFDHETIAKKLKIPFVAESTGDLAAYFTHTIPPTSDGQQQRTLRLIFIDTYDVALLGRDPQSSKYAIADKMMTQNNPNHPENSNSPIGLAGVERRYVAFGGGLGKPQLTWLRATLESARDAKETVLIVSHQPILPDSAQGVTLVWNCYEVMDLLREFKGSIAASFSGHAHEGGYLRDYESGIHFRVFEAALESRSPLSTYAFVDLYKDRLVVRGKGDCQSAVYDLGHLDY